MNPTFTRLIPAAFVVTTGERLRALAREKTTTEYRRTLGQVLPSARPLASRR